MFARKKAPEVVPVVHRNGRPAPGRPQVAVVDLGVYEEAAKKLGFQPAQLLEEKVLRFLSAENIPVYDLDKVDRYMVELAEKQNTDFNKVYWVWCPLRECDKMQTGWDGHRANRQMREPWGHGSYQPESRTYQRAVPLHILRRVSKIQEQFGDQVRFFVSDYADPRPDPFIMVTAGLDRIVFGVWDEPTFAVNDQE